VYSYSISSLIYEWVLILSFINFMIYFNCLLELLVVSIGAAHLIPLDESIKDETHTFRWTLDDHLNGSVCATANTPSRFGNGTTNPIFWKLASSECLVPFLHTTPHTNLVGHRNFSDDESEYFKPCSLPFFIC
jgi:hypothetical protein